MQHINEEPVEALAIKEKLRTILGSVLGHTDFELHDEVTAPDVDGWDSLSHMMIITQIEKDFSIRFKLRDLNKLKNMGALVAMIQSKL